MPNRKLVAVCTALLLIAGPRAQADIDVETLRAINVMIDRQEWSTLREYLDANPWLLQGEGTLARELRLFVTTFDRDQNGTFAFHDQEKQRGSSQHGALFEPLTVY